MLGHNGCELGKRETKITKTAIKTLPGYVMRARVRCGKPNCKCARGDRHVAHYHVWHTGGVRRRDYVRRADVAAVAAACEANRQHKARQRAGRAEWGATLRRARELFALLRGE